MFNVKVKNTVGFATLLSALLAVSISDTAVAGLIAHYTFDGNANDSSGNGLHGTVTGATLAPDRFGAANSAYSFNGSGNQIVVADSPLFAFGQNPYSFSAWVNLDNVTTYQPMLGQWGSSSTTRATVVTYNATDPNPLNVRVHEENGASNFTDIPVTISTGDWHLLSVVRETTGNTKLYFDAVFQGTASNRETILDASSSFFIGKDPNNPNSFTGLIDDVRIYDSALSEAQIQALFSAVPEPSAITLSALGLLSLGFVGWRRRRR